MRRRSHLLAFALALVVAIPCAAQDFYHYSLFVRGRESFEIIQQSSRLLAHKLKLALCPAERQPLTQLQREPERTLILLITSGDSGIAAKTRPVVIVSRYDPDASADPVCSFDKAGPNRVLMRLRLGACHTWIVFR